MLPQAAGYRLTLLKPCFRMREIKVALGSNATGSCKFRDASASSLHILTAHADLCVGQPKLIVTASFGIEPGRKVEYIPLVEQALELSSHRPSKVLIYNRPNMVRSIEFDNLLLF